MDPQSPVIPVAKSKAPKIIGIIAGFIVAVALAAFGGYWYGEQNSKPATTPVSQTPVSPDVAQQTSTHFVTSIGHPLGTDKRLTVKLGVPGELQAIKVNSSIQDPGLLTVLGDGTFNREIGRWQLGRPTTNDSSLDDISLVHIDPGWLASNTAGNEDFFQVPPFGLSLPSANMTSAQKQAFIAELKSATEKCSTDTKNGFVIAKSINVCLKFMQVKQAAGSYDPYVDINGYGVIDGIQLVFAGSLSLRDDKTYTEEQETALQGEFKPEKLPVDTQAVLDRYVAALKATTIVMEKR